MKHRLKKLDEGGIVSIVVTMILILVLTLVVLAMSQNSIREQRQSLDRQLSDQAYYNAESGINDWVNYLYKNPTAPVSKTVCETDKNKNPLNTAQYPSPPTAPVPDANLGTDGNNKYSCLLYDRQPKSIIFNNLQLKDAKTVPITPDRALQSLTFSWVPDSSSGDIQFFGCNFDQTSFLPTSVPPNCNLGGLEVNLVSTTSLSRDYLINKNFIGYFLPSSSGSGFISDILNGVDPPNQGLRGIANCTVAGCTLKIDKVGLAVGTTMFLHLKTIYLPSSITITGADTAGTAVSFVGAQIMLDATGKSNDVLRRVQVRVGATSQYAGTDFSLRTADSICKLISVNKDALPKGTATLESGPASQCTP